MTKKNISELIQKLDTNSDKTAEKIIQKLKKIGKIAVPYLIDSAKNKKNQRIRKWSLQALGVIGDLRSAPILIGALNDKRMTKVVVFVSTCFTL